jgi:predicted Rdx family selenoprotein
VSACEDVDVGQRCAQAPRQRLVGGILLHRVEPDHPVGEPAEPGHLLGDDRRIPDLEPVGADHHHGASRHPPVTVLAQEALERFSDPGPAVPVEDLGGRAAKRLVGTSVREHRRDAGEPGAEAEGLPVPVGAERRVREDEQRSRVVGHRARDVEE